MKVTDHVGLIFRGILIALLIIFLVVFYQYSENGRYIYHDRSSENQWDEYAFDTRTGTVYGYFSNPDSKEKPPTFYKIELQTGKIWYNLIQVFNNIPKTAVTPGNFKLDEWAPPSKQPPQTIHPK